MSESSPHRPHIARIDRPRSNRAADEIERKLRLLDAPHMKPLSDFIRRLRVARPDDWIPWIDPTSAGVDARILHLCEAPGGKAVTQRGGSGFVSVDNDDPSATNLWHFLRAADVDRCHEIVTWNAIPWYLGSDTKIGHPRAAERLAAQPSLNELVDLMSNLRVAVLLGKEAQRVWQQSVIGRIELGAISTVAAPHQSPLSVNRRPESKLEIVAALHEARGIAGYA